MRRGDLDQAVRILELNVEAYNSAAAWSRLADAYEGQGELERSLEASEEALSRITTETRRADRLRSTNLDRVERLRAR